MVEARGKEELVLRYFAARVYRDRFKGNISDWLDNFMEEVLLKTFNFNEDEEWKIFTALFDELRTKFGSYAFVKYRGGQPIGGVAPAYYEAVTCGSIEAFDNLKSLSPDEAKFRLAKIVESEEFRAVTGPGANSLPKMNERIRLIGRTFTA